ncbi:MAG TPA: cytidylate kinase-like family protein [Candidatus Acidoferrum sp.]|nr:cytidylate kinase-like family protein [Candidatus Acidoferrum sp.]
MSPLNEQAGLGLCRAYLRSQGQNLEQSAREGHWPHPGPAITLSYQTGAGAHEMAEELALILQRHESTATPAWTVFDRELVERVLEDHQLPRSIARYMPEDRRSFIRDVMDELVGLRPPSWVLVPQIAETVLQLAEAGRVILVGRGASFITARLPNVFHVRLIASLPTRIERVRKAENLPPREAARLITRSDRGRGRYVKAHFHGRVGDDLQYHLVVNTDRIPLPEAAELVAEAARRSFHESLEPKV